MNIPIYEAIIENEADGLSCISFVENPAMESNMLVFSEAQRTLSLFQENYKRCITGVVIRADHPVYRFDEYYGEYFIKFSKETIRELTEKYSKEKLLNNVSIHHNGKLIDDVVMLEFFIKDIEKGINPKQFEDIEDGSLFCTFKINNEELWNEILKGNFGGLSMELFIGLEQQYNDNVRCEPVNSESLFEYLFSISDKEFDDILKLEQKVDIELAPDGATLTDVQLYQLGKDNDGKIIIYFNPETNEYGKLKYKEVVNIIPKGVPVLPFPEFKTPNNVIVTKTKDNPTIIDILNKPQYVMISYNDEKPGAATGYRTCFIGALGYTTRGNECIRVYEYNGDSRQGFRDGRWRLLLTKRILDLKTVDYMEGIVTAPPQFNHNGDNGMSRVVKIAKI